MDEYSQEELNEIKFKIGSFNNSRAHIYLNKKTNITMTSLKESSLIEIKVDDSKKMTENCYGINQNEEKIVTSKEFYVNSKNNVNENVKSQINDEEEIALKLKKINDESKNNIIKSNISVKKNTEILIDINLDNTRKSPRVTFNLESKPELENFKFNDEFLSIEEENLIEYNNECEEISPIINLIDKNKNNNEDIRIKSNLNESFVSKNTSFYQRKNQKSEIDFYINSAKLEWKKSKAFHMGSEGDYYKLNKFFLKDEIEKMSKDQMKELLIMHANNSYMYYKRAFKAADTNPDYVNNQIISRGKSALANFIMNNNTKANLYLFAAKFLVYKNHQRFNLNDQTVSYIKYVEEIIVDKSIGKDKTAICFEKISNKSSSFINLEFIRNEAKDFKNKIYSNIFICL